jgi:pSer/pThr/pTyr-binding forkhead associated (FHA) protein
VASLVGTDNECHDLIKPVVAIGRALTNDIVLGDDPRVSRSHAELRSSDGQWLLIDLASRNGTKVNNRLIAQHPLRDGDRVRIGSSSFVYVAGQDANATEIGTMSGTVTNPELSARESEILKCVALGLTDRETGDQLHISISTVRSHLDRIRDKTGLRKRAELTRLAVDLGILRR